MTLSIWNDNPVEKTVQEAAVAIVGGGILGVGCAYWLYKLTGIKAVIVDSAHLAAGSSGRNAGFLLRGIQSYYNETIKLYGRDTARFLFSFGEQSQAHVREFLREFGNTFECEPCGSYLLACSLEELEDLHQSAELLHEDEFQVEYLSQDPLNRNFYGALYNPGDLGVHPVKLVQELARASAATIYENDPVQRIESDGSNLLLHTPRATIVCQKVLLATNAYSALIDPFFKDQLHPVRGQILVTQPLKKTVLDRLCYANYGWEYFRQLPDGRLLLGGCRELHLDEEVGFADIVTPAVQSSLEIYLKDRFPELSGTRIDYRWSGLMAFSKDGLPILGKVPHLANLFFAVAGNGHGLGYGLALSRLLVEMVMDGKSAGVFDFARPGLVPKVAATVGPAAGP